MINEAFWKGEVLLIVTL